MTLVDQLSNLVLYGTDSVLLDAMNIFGICIVFVKLHPTLGLIAISPMFISFAMLRVYNKRVKPTYRKARKEVGKLGAKLGDNLGDFSKHI